MSEIVAAPQEEHIFDKIAQLLPEEYRQRYLAHVSKLRKYEGDEFFLLLESCGYLALMANKLPERVSETAETIKTLIDSYQERAGNVKALTTEFDMTFYRGNAAFKDIAVDLSNRMDQTTDILFDRSTTLKQTQDDIIKAINDAWEITKANNTFLYEKKKLWIKELLIAAFLFFCLGAGATLLLMKIQHSP